MIDNPAKIDVAASPALSLGNDENGQLQGLSLLESFDFTGITRCRAVRVGI